MSFYPYGPIGDWLKLQSDDGPVYRGFIGIYACKPVAASATSVLAATATVANVETVVDLDDVTQPAVPCVPQIKGSAASATGDVVIEGTNMADEPITDTIAGNGASARNGAEVFKTITAITLPADTGTAGTSTSAGSPSTDLSGGTDNAFNISVDGDDAELVVLDETTCVSGLSIAAEMESKINALGGNKALVTVVFAGGVYVITSGTLGTDSEVVVTDATENNAADNLKIGALNAGVEAAGTANGNTYSVGTTKLVGVPFKFAAAGQMLTATFDGGADAGTLTPDVDELEKNYYSPAGTPNGVKQLVLYFIAAPSVLA